MEKNFVNPPGVAEPGTSVIHHRDEVQGHVEDEFDKNFKPKGAIAFFILLVILGVSFYYGIYFLMLSRL